MTDHSLKELPLIFYLTLQLQYFLLNQLESLIRIFVKHLSIHLDNINQLLIFTCHRQHIENEFFHKLKHPLIFIGIINIKEFPILFDQNLDEIFDSLIKSGIVYLFLEQKGVIVFVNELVKGMRHEFVHHVEINGS